MKAKDKAKELVDKYNDKELFYLLTFRQAKQCALIAVDEIINSIEVGYADYKSLSKINYWQEVKQEIIKL